MSTRANIKIKYKNKELYLYSHYDGYPDGGVGDDIKDIIRLNDWDSTGLVMDLIATYELTEGLHGDIEFYYILDLDDNTLMCHHVKDVIDSIVDSKDSKLIYKKE